MVREPRLRIGPCFLAVVLLSALTTHAAFAEDAASGTHGASGGSSLSSEQSVSRPPSTDDASGGTAKFENHAAPGTGAASKAEGTSGSTAEQHSTRIKEGPQGNASTRPKGDGVKVPNGEAAHVVAKGVNSVDARGKTEPSAIDTRVTVPSATLRPDKARDRTPLVKFGAPANFWVRRSPTAGASESITRNAIGLPVVPREGSRGPSDEPHGLPAQVLAPAAPGTVQGSVADLNRAEGGIDRPTVPRSSTGSIVNAPFVQRGKIDGTGMIRPGFAPSGVGGPAKTVAGINGTTFRLKR